LLAIGLAVGIVVDDAIVMLENVERHVQEGLSPMDAAIKGARELVMPVLSMTITLAAVYAPIGFQGGLTGALFREFAFTLAGAVLISGFVALTLSPMMSSRLLRAKHDPKGFQGWLDRQFDRLHFAYQHRLEKSLKTYPVTIIIAVLVMLLAVPFYMFSKKELAPKEDQGVIFGIIQSQAGSSLDQTMLFADKAEQVFSSFPECELTFQVITPGGGFSGMVTKPWSERKRTVMELEGEAFGKASAIAGIQLIPITPAPLPGGSDFPVEFVITTTAEPRQLYDIAQTLVQKCFASGLFMYADTDLKYDLPQSQIVIDRDKVAALGLDLQSVSNDLNAMLGGNFVNRFSIQGRSYKVIPQVQRQARLNPEQLLDLSLIHI
jgi:multidrug efflux pump